MKSDLIKIELSADEYRELVLLAKVGYKTAKDTPFDDFISALNDEQLEKIAGSAYKCGNATIKVATS